MGIELNIDKLPVVARFLFTFCSFANRDTLIPTMPAVRSGRTDTILREFTVTQEEGRAHPMVICNHYRHRTSINVTRIGRYFDSECPPYENHRLRQQVQYRKDIRNFAISLTAAQAKKVNQYAAETILLDGKPFNLFESSPIRTFFYTLIPSYIPPNATVITNDWLPLIYNQIRIEFKEKHIDKCDYINVFYDESNNYVGKRILNISFSIPNDSRAFF